MVIKNIFLFDFIIIKLLIVCPCDLTGAKCNKLLDQCSNDGNSTKCLNGGICTQNECGYNCTCLKGFTGDLCEKRKNLCEPNKCLNGAVCIEYENDYHCECPCKYFTGAIIIIG